MKEKGMRITCDRCGDSVFVEQHVSDYGKLEYYDEPPDGWKTVNVTPLDPQATPVELYSNLYPEHISGVTFSGGDPFHPKNRDTILRLAKDIKERISGKNAQLKHYGKTYA